ncbi:MAG: SLC13 family permease, partial [Rubrivivax sp.]
PYRWALVKLIGATSLYSALLNNTAVVASLIGPLRASDAHPPSRLLLPMCYAASIGGILTLVGTSTNLLVNSFMIGRGMPALHLFDLLPVGLPVLVVCSATMVLLFPYLLPPRAIAATTPEAYFVEAQVLDGSPLAGRSVEAAGLRHLGHLFLSEIERNGRLIAPVGPDEVLVAGDHLVFAGDVTRLDLLAGFDGLAIEGQRAGLSMHNLVEVIVTVNSSIARRTLREVDFRSRFDAAVIAVRRGDRRLSGRIGSIRLEVGDTLVLTAGPDFEKRNNLTRNFIVVSHPQVAKFVDPRHGLAALLGFVAVIGLAAFGTVHFIKGLLVLLTVFLLAGFTRLTELRRNAPYPLVFIIGSALIISQVMLSSGVAALLADVVLGVFEPFGTMGALASVLLLAWVLTELMTNNAAAALAFPIAIGIADRLGASPMPFVMAVIYGASASFLTPYGYQTNLMVMAPGRYILIDYLRAGAPVALAFLGVALFTIPVFFPFR